MENLLDVYLKPGLKTVSLNLSVRDLCDVQGWVCQLPVGVSQLFLKFSTWLPVGVSIADGGIGELTLPVGLDLLHITFDWWDGHCGHGQSIAPVIAAWSQSLPP
mmetsp:Transcript_5739/g.21817  ORF Transcript_5739/g.21817 Transcript_5739/m.21817 type:complete len:104 (+) Transcript_5739:474-785(+)